MNKIRVLTVAGISLTLCKFVICSNYDVETENPDMGRIHSEVSSTMAFNLQDISDGIFLVSSDDCSHIYDAQSFSVFKQVLGPMV